MSAVTAAAPRRAQVSGRYAGPASRAVAAAIDVGVVLGGFSAIVAIIRLLADSLLDWSFDKANGLAATIGLGAWALVYLVAATAITGRTVGKGVVGLRIVRANGGPLSFGRALVRVLMFPLSTSFLALGLLLILVDRRSRGLHDLIAGTAVVYDWGDRQAELPAPLTAYLERHAAPRD